MTREDFDLLVRELEDRYRGRMGALRRQVLAWVAVGFVVIAGWILAAVALGGFLFWWGLTFPTVAGIWMILCGAILLLIGTSQLAILASVRIGPRPGVLLDRSSAGRLFEELDDITAIVGCGKLKAVRLTSAFNASVLATPRLGIFGWIVPSLELGLPLLSSLTLAEARSVIAHECGHMSRRDGGFENTSYRLREMWQGLLPQLAGTSLLGLPRQVMFGVNWLLDWYWPRLNARMIVLARDAEYRSDACGAAVAGAQVTGDALWRNHCLDQRLKDDFWPALHRLAGELPDPPDDVLARMRECFSTPPEPGLARRAMDVVCRTMTDTADTHPAFPDRLAALGLSIDGFIRDGFPGPPAHSAATALLGSGLSGVEQQLGEIWQKENRGAWRQLHGRLRAAQLQLRQTAPQETTDLGGVDRLWRQALHFTDIHQQAEAVPVLRTLLSLAPRHHEAQLMLGNHLLASDPAEGIMLLEHALATGIPEVAPIAGGLLADHFRKTGEGERLRAVRRKLADFERDLEGSQAERRRLSSTDHFLPHQLNADDLGRLRAVLRENPVQLAWLARKSLLYLPQRPLYVLAVKSRSQSWWSGGEDDQQLVRKMIPHVRLPGQFLVIAARGRQRRVARKVQRVESACVHDNDLCQTGDSQATPSS